MRPPELWRFLEAGLLLSLGDTGSLKLNDPGSGLLGGFDGGGLLPSLDDTGSLKLNDPGFGLRAGFDGVGLLPLLDGTGSGVYPGGCNRGIC